MESVKIEVERQLGCDYAVNLKDWGKIAWFTDGVKYQAYMIEIFDNEGWRVHFAICEKEFDQNKHQPEVLVELARIRFVDSEWSLKHAKERAGV